MFANLKRSAPTSPTAPMSQKSSDDSNSKRQKYEKSVKKMQFFRSWNEGTFTPAIEKDYRDELVPMLRDGKYNANITTAPLTVRYSDVGPKGNLGSKFVPEHAVDKAKFVLTTEKGVDSKVLAAMPNIETEQDGYFKWLKTTALQMMSMAWDQQIPLFSAQYKKCKALAKKEAKKNKDVNVDARAKELFLEGASTPVGEKLDEDGDATAVHKMQRRYQFTSKQTGEVVNNRPTFWKRNRDGDYDDITEKIKFLPKGSVVIAQVSFRAYAMTSYYGISTDMGKNIIVVWQKPHTTTTSSFDPQAVPYFE